MPKSKKTERKGKIKVLFEQQSGLCAYTGREMTLALGFNNTATIEHVVPVSKGGARKWYNEVAVCADVNQEKGKKDLLIWMIERKL